MHLMAPSRESQCCRTEQKQTPKESKMDTHIQVLDAAGLKALIVTDTSLMSSAILYLTLYQTE